MYLAINNKYPTFGSPMSSRSFNATSYKYGFNGKEKDDETATQDYGMRIYNPVLGKFLSIDPLYGKFPMLSTYQFASNSPIENDDLDGLEANNKTERALTAKELKTLTSEGNNLQKLILLSNLSKESKATIITTSGEDLYKATNDKNYQGVEKLTMSGGILKAQLKAGISEVKIVKPKATLILQDGAVLDVRTLKVTETIKKNYAGGEASIVSGDIKLTGVSIKISVLTVTPESITLKTTTEKDGKYDKYTTTADVKNKGWTPNLSDQFIDVQIRTEKAAVPEIKPKPKGKPTPIKG